MNEHSTAESQPLRLAADAQEDDAALIEDQLPVPRPPAADPVATPQPPTALPPRLDELELSAPPLLDPQGRDVASTCLRDTARLAIVASPALAAAAGEGDAEAELVAIVEADNEEAASSLGRRSPSSGSAPPRARADAELLRLRWRELGDALAPLLGPQAAALSSRGGGCLGRCFKMYTTRLARTPWHFVGLYVVLTMLLVVCLWRPLEVERDFSAFVKADGFAARNRDTFLAALKVMQADEGAADARRLISSDARTGVPHPPRLGAGAGVAGGAFRSSGRSLASKYAADANIVYFSRGFSLYYTAKGGNAFNEPVLREIATIEGKLRSMPQWRHLCEYHVSYVDSKWLCSPGESIVALAWPTLLERKESSAASSDSSQQGFRMRFDGRGRDLLPLPAMFAHLHSSLVNGRGKQSMDPYTFLPNYFALPTDFNAGLQNMGPRSLRSRFTFCMSYGLEQQSQIELSAQLAEMKAVYEEFVTTELYPALLEVVKGAQHVEVHFHGAVIDQYEITAALSTDLLWSFGSIFFVTLYMWIHIRSVVVSFGAFCIIFASVPVAYVLSPAEKATIASFMSLFLITVIDIDVIFVFVDFWDQSAHLGDFSDRLTTTILRAGKSCLATSLTTSLSFYANLVSCLQPLREFGLFMGTSVMAVYVLALLLLPPLLVIRERARERAVLRKVVDVTLRSTDREALDVRHRQEGCSFEKVVHSGLQGVASRVERRARWVVCATFLCIPIFVTGVLQGLQIAITVPEVFPSDHNQIQARNKSREFSGLPVPEVRGFTQNVRTCQPGEGESGQDDEDDDESPGSNVSNSSVKEPCILEWCLSKPRYSAAAVSAEEHGASCWQKPARRFQGMTAMTVGWDISSCETVVVQGRIVADAVGAAMQRRRSLLDEVMKGLVRNSTLADPKLRGRWPADMAARLPLIIETWETGATHVARVLQMEGRDFNVSRVNASGGGRDFCMIETLCFFGQSCDMEHTGWRRFWSANASALVELLDSNSSGARELRPVFNLANVGATRKVPWERALRFGRQLQYEVLPANKRFDVSVVWGLRAPRVTPTVGAPLETWGFDPTFEPDSPWAQRAMMKMCSDMPESLLVLKKDCWVVNFRDYMVWLGRKFPSREFDKDIASWWTVAGLQFNYAVWWRGARLKAARVNFEVNANKRMSASAALSYMALWDDFVKSRNKQASVFANRAWHTSQVWVGGEAQTAILGSTKDTVLIECGLSWFGILMFTGDPVIALLVLTLVIINITGLLFVLVAIMEWTIGPIEVIFLIVFLGYSVTYGLHMAYNYSVARALQPDVAEVEQVIEAVNVEKAIPALVDAEDSHVDDTTDATKFNVETDVDAEARAEAAPPLTEAQMRRIRARTALLNVGGAVISSSISTVGSSIFLMMCTLDIFLRLGTVVMSVTVLSILFTILSLPAVLMVFGPSTDPFYKRLPRRVVIGLVEWLLSRVS